jgi:ribosomal protein S7
VGNISKQLKDPALKTARVHVGRKPHRVVVTVRPRRRTAFWLHTLSEPARVVLDIRR